MEYDLKTKTAALKNDIKAQEEKLWGLVTTGSISEMDALNQKILVMRSELHQITQTRLRKMESQIRSNIKELQNNL